MLELRNIHKVYNAGTVNDLPVENFSLSVPERNFVSVVGSNGSGKRRCSTSSAAPSLIDEGKILINGTDDFKAEGTCPPSPHRPGLSGSVERHMSQHEYIGKSP